MMQSYATLWTLTSPPRWNPEDTQACLTCPHPFFIRRCLLSSSPLLLFALRITVSKSNLKPCALFPSGPLPLNLLSQYGESCFLPQEKGFHALRHWFLPSLPSRDSIHQQRQLPSPASKWDQCSNGGQVRKAQRRGKESPNQTSPIHTLFKYIWVYVHYHICGWSVLQNWCTKNSICNVRNCY